MADSSIVTLTLNPALDFATDVPEMRPQEKLRCSDASMFPGGGGVNVARAIRNLGGDATACVALGGPNGQALELLLRAEGVRVEPIYMDIQTRHSLSVKEATSGNIFRFMLPGTPWTQLIEAHFLSAATKLVEHAKFCVLSGSMPPGTNADTIRRLATICHNNGCALIVDTSGPTLRALAQQESLDVDILRMDEEEAQESTNSDLETLADFVDAAKRMIERGAGKTIIMGLGATGNLLVTGDGQSLFCPAPVVEMVSRVGAGDSFVGAMVLAISNGESWQHALMDGSAAAAAAVMTPGTRLCERETFDGLRATIEVQTL